MPTVLAIMFAQIVALLIEFIGVKQPGEPAGSVSVQKDLEVADNKEKSCVSLKCPITHTIFGGSRLPYRVLWQKVTEMLLEFLLFCPSFCFFS